LLDFSSIDEVAFDINFLDIDCLKMVSVFFEFGKIGSMILGVSLLDNVD